MEVLDTLTKIEKGEGPDHLTEKEGEGPDHPTEKEGGTGLDHLTEREESTGDDHYARKTIDNKFTDFCDITFN